MKKYFFLTILGCFLFVFTSNAQSINWANWAPLDSHNGIELQYRFGYYKDYQGKAKTQLQIKAYNTRNKKVMVNFKRIMFSTGKKDFGGHLFYANEDSKIFTFRTNGTSDNFEYNWTVEYYKN